MKRDWRMTDAVDTTERFTRAELLNNLGDTIDTLLQEQDKLFVWDNTGARYLVSVSIQLVRSDP